MLLIPSRSQLPNRSPTICPGSMSKPADSDPPCAGSISAPRPNLTPGISRAPHTFPRNNSNVSRPGWERTSNFCFTVSEAGEPSRRIISSKKRYQGGYGCCRGGTRLGYTMRSRPVPATARPGRRTHRYPHPAIRVSADCEFWKGAVSARRVSDIAAASRTDGVPPVTFFAKLADGGMIALALLGCFAYISTSV